MPHNDQAKSQCYVLKKLRVNQLMNRNKQKIKIKEIKQQMKTNQQKRPLVELHAGSSRFQDIHKSTTS